MSELPDSDIVDDGIPSAGPSHRDGPMLFVDDLDAPELTKDDYHHISKVLRTPDGAPIVVCDGAGSWRRALLSRHPEPVGGISTVEAPSPRLVVAFALIKGDRPELIVQKLTELGIDEIVPLRTDNGVVRWKADKAAKQHERLERIAREAAMQCRRTTLAVVAGAVSFDEFVAGADVWRCDVGGAALGERWRSRGAADAVAVAIGPEGGWSERERALCPESVRFAEHILRAETAAIGAAALLGALRGAAI